MNAIKFLEEWYQANCDGSWEHSYGIKIETLDNPGWAITIDLTNTNFEDLQIEKFVEETESDWLSIITKDKQLIASGDPYKLEILLTEIKQIFDFKETN